jgi:hypothetical protein
LRDHYSSDGCSGRRSTYPVVMSEEIEVSLTLRVRLTDWDGLRAAGLGAVSRGAGAEEVRARAEQVASGPYGALAVLIDPDRLLAGIDSVEAVTSVVAVGAPGSFGAGRAPDFGALFPLTPPSGAETPWLLTPRTAAVLHGQLRILADCARNELDELGGAPVRPETRSGVVFAALPKPTWGQDADWRIRFISSFCALAADLAAGEWPRPRCPAEEMALHLALLDAEEALSDVPEGVEADVAGLPVSVYDYDWSGCRSTFFRHADVLLRYEAISPALEEPASWFTAFETG